MVSVHEHYSLRPYNSFGLEANARYFITIDSIETLQLVLQDSRWQGIPCLVLGGGSNILLTGDFPGLVLHINIQSQIIKDQGEHVIVSLGAGNNWHETVLFCVAQGYAGIENLALIPGTVGAAPIQNIGAYGVELQDVFVGLDAIEIATGRMRHFTKADCQFAYRDSIFKHILKNRYIITQVSLQLSKKPVFHTEYAALRDQLAQLSAPLSLQTISEAVIQIRRSKLPDPRLIGNAGSFFKNPSIPSADFSALQTLHPDIPHHVLDGARVKIPAAWLIDQCGFKGQRHGEAGVHDKQALVLVNHGHASGQEIQQLAETIQQQVLGKFGVQLAPEVNII